MGYIHHSIYTPNQLFIKPLPRVCHYDVLWLQLYVLSC